MKGKQLAIAATIAVLFTVFIITSVEAVYPTPEYDDYCDDTPPTPSLGEDCTGIAQERIRNCTERGGEPRYEYNESGCKTDMSCSMCRQKYEDASERRDLVGFIVAAIAGVLAITAVLSLDLLPQITYGFILGGLAVLFTATSMHFSTLHRWVRPAILLAELALVLYLSYTAFRE